MLLQTTVEKSSTTMAKAPNSTMAEEGINPTIKTMVATEQRWARTMAAATRP